MFLNQENYLCRLISLEITMKNFFAILIQKHPVFGLLPYLFQLKGENKDFYLIGDRLMRANLQQYKTYLSENQIKIIEQTEEYADNNLKQHFTNKKITAVEFVRKLDAGYVKKFIRPFIEKRIAEIVALAIAEEMRIFYREDKDAVYKDDEIRVEPEAADVVFHFEKLEGSTRYFQTVRHKGEIISLTDKAGAIISNDPCWLLVEHKLYHFRNNVEGKKLAAFFNKAFIEVPGKLEPDFYINFVASCIRNFHVEATGFTINKVEPEKAALLSYSTFGTEVPMLALGFKYGGELLQPADGQNRYVFFERDEGFGFRVFERDRNWESRMAKKLTELGLQKKYDNYYLPVGSETEKYGIITWLNEHADALKEAGFVTEQDFSNVRYFTGQITVQISYSEKQDWFDVFAVARFGNDFEIPIYKLRKYLLEGIREYVLPDGRVAVLPEQWFGKFEDLVTFGKSDKEKIRVDKRHFPLIKQSLGMKQVRDMLTDGIKEMVAADKSVAVPAAVNAQLRHYQLEGFRWLDTMRRANLGACLADDMGLGKTLQTLCVIAQNIAQRNGGAFPVFEATGGQLDLFEQEGAMQPVKPSLIVMPASLVHNWSDEIKKFIPGLKFLIYTGQHRKMLIERFHKVAIVLTTYGTVRNDIEALAAIDFDYLILDESQTIKNPASKIAKAVNKLRCTHKLTLSGTPIENSLTDLWSHMNFLNKGLLGDLAFFRRYFATPIERNNDIVKQEKLKLIISPFLLRRTKKEVEKQLPELVEEYIYCEMSDEQKHIYQEEKSKIRNMILQSIEERGLKKSGVTILQGLSRLRQLACHPQMIFPDLTYDSGKFTEITRNLETLISEGHKILLFSSYVKHLRLLEGFLQQNRIGYSMLTGQSTRRGKIIKEFQNDERKHVFLISMKAGGVGLNLTRADYVFLLDPWWNPAVENQAVNRAHRIGQTKHVFAYRFITLQTVEEKIMNLQRKKSELADLFIRSGNPLSQLTIDNIRDLIS